MAQELSTLEALVSGLDHPEGVAYGPDGQLYAGGEAGQVYRVSLKDKTFQQFGSTGGYGLGIAIDADANLYVCDMGIHAVVRVTPTGESSVYCAGPADNPLQVPNYPVFDAAGNLYVSDSRGWGQSNGLIYKFAPGGEGQVWSSAAPGFTNGMALSPDNRFLYVVESTPPQITRIAINADGSAGAAEVVVRLAQTVPDGIAFDAAGRLYIACYAPDRIYRLSPQGALDILFDDWTRIVINAPCNLAFVGPELDRLVLSSLGGATLLWADIGATGQPTHYPKL